MINVFVQIYVKHNKNQMEYCVTDLNIVGQRIIIVYANTL